MANNLPEKSEVAKREERILKFWQEQQIFEKSLAKNVSDEEFVFYDGPPFATGTPHYGHILASAIKDVIPRYQTMRGKRVARRWGWDCHGLPVENIVEKELKISGKKQIEELGIDKFNQTARDKVLTYVADWQKVIERMGRWVDFAGSYKTMDNTYIESVWWALSEMNKLGLLYEGTRVLPYCPRCETPLANAEIAMDNSYKDISDISVFVKFELLDEPGTYLLVWTTTPWTLPGNTAVAVGPQISYVKVKIGQEYFILAKDRLLASIKSDYSIEEEFLGRDLIGKKYKPPFAYYLTEGRVCGADFVNTVDGTGIVHIAPAFGEDDMALAKKENLPIVVHVDHTGRFQLEVKDFAGQLVKPKDNHQVTDIEIIKFLAKRDILFDKQKIVHSYPHCYRCETPLYYYAVPSWFIKIQDLKPRLRELNQEINWIPEHLKFGRFAKSMAGAPDWNISRNRFWATPLPIWKCDQCQFVKVISSLVELQEEAISAGNKYLAMRHGEADHNVQDIVSSRVDNPHHLTDKGREQIKAVLSKLEKAKIDLIISSDFVRTRETTELIARELSLPTASVIYDKRLREVDFGDFNGRPVAEYYHHFSNPIDKFTKGCPNGEDLMTVKRRMMNLIDDLEGRYQGKNILLISHETPITMLFAGALGLGVTEASNFKETHDDFLLTGEVKDFSYKPLPHNHDYELDFHRPYIDKIKLTCNCGGLMSRIPEVVDCWFESGSMPFAAEHYPFEREEQTRRRVPADFVSEYIAQTRTWFYYMHVVATILFNKIPFKNVVTTGSVLASDGQKMSKSKGNFPDPLLILNQYGADALRFYLLSSPLLKAEDACFSELGVGEIYRKVINRLDNVWLFYQTYADVEQSVAKKIISRHVLDRWIIARLNQLVGEVTEAMDRYELDQALRVINIFIEDLSVWYVRRSRDRFKPEAKEERVNASATLAQVFNILARVLAPFTPFVAEEIYRQLEGDQESVHLDSWPRVVDLVDQGLLEDMIEVRRIVSLGLEARAKAGIKVRQPLARLKIKKMSLEIKNNSQLLDLIKDEVNVKEISSDPELVSEVELDLELTPELKEEGELRDLIRKLQDWRKKSGLKPGELAIMPVSLARRDLVLKHADVLKLAVNAKEFTFV